MKETPFVPSLSMKNDERVIKTGSGQTDVSGIRNGGEGGLFSQLFLCLSRACLGLGKMIFQYINCVIKKGVHAGPGDWEWRLSLQW